MKIGILTFHDADNYGAVLQAYALTNTIKKLKPGSNVEIINYNMPFILKSYKVFKIRTDSVIVLLKSIISSILNLKSSYTKKTKFRKFRSEHMNISDVFYRKSVSIDYYDAYVVGSDQVWNTDITKFEDVFFLNFCKDDSRKISYAASLGKNILSSSDREFIKENINNIDYISVREDNAVKLIQEFTDKNIERVLDPTLLLSKKEWEYLNFENKIDNTEYILLYMVSHNEEALKSANELSHKLGLPVWYINNSFRKTTFGFKNIRGAGPHDFLNLVRNASYIVTSSFHGTVFSIIFRKNFVTVPYKKTSSRMTDLLKMIKLEERIINNSIELDENYNLEVNYDTAQEIIEGEIEKSLNFLKKSLHD